MAPALAPALIGQEAAACALLGLVLGSVRAVFPVRGRAAFLPDMALVGAVLLGLQSYAAALSAGGVLRWYMPGSAFLCAFGAEQLLRPALQALEQGLFWLAAGPLRLHGPLASASCQAPLRVPALQALAGSHGLVFLHRRVHGRSFSSGKRRSALPRRASPARPARGGTSIQAYRPPRGRKSYILLPFIIAVFSLTVNP